MNPDPADPRQWKQRYSWVTGLGTTVSFLMALALLFATPRVVAWFPLGGDPVTWPQLCGVLLSVICIFHLPALIDIERYRPYAWIGAVVARGAIGLLCFVGVVCFDAPRAFLGWTVIEWVIGASQVYVLVRLESAENGRGPNPRGEWDGNARRGWTAAPAPRDVTPAVGRWKQTYCWAAWIGIAANWIIVIPLVFTPQWMLRILGVPSAPVLWAQMAGLLLGLISGFQIPAARDVDRFRPFAWLAIFPAYTSGFIFCAIAVIGLGADDAFLLGVALALPLAVLQTIILSQLAAAENRGQPGWRACSWKVCGRTAVALLVAIAVLGSIGWHKLMRVYPAEPASSSFEEVFKHGSIGTEDANGLPYWIWMSLPSVFPEYLPKPGGYASLGFLWEPGTELPVGFSRRRIGFDRVGINCAFCHAGSVQIPGEAQPRVYAGAPATTANILGYQRFLFNCARDPRFTAGTLMPAIARQTRLSLADAFLYRNLLIPATRKALREQAKLWEWTTEKDRPEWGPGRIEPFNPVKVSILNSVDPHVIVGSTLGTSDMQPLWNLGRLPGRAFHWDGLNTDLREVVDSSALGDGATPKSIPLPRMRELETWIKNNPAPRFPFSNVIHSNLLARGETIYNDHCARCHAPGSEGVGKVMAVSGNEGVGTDPCRAQMWTPESAAAYNAYLGNRSWRFRTFRSTGGYVNVPLDGLWLRAPYLHNGSVPTLADLLKPVNERPAVFWRGLNQYDPVHVGFVSDGPEARAHGFRYDTSGRGNSNAGHVYGTTLPAADKTALIEYLKTL